MKNKILKMIRKIKNFFHLCEAFIANIYYFFPSRKLKVIGVTGTDGKTTTTHLIYHILKSSGKKVSMISTVYGCVGKEVFDTGLHTTTPRSFFIQQLLKKAVDNKDKYFVLEVTSHALDQNRVFGVRFEAAVLTNVTHEHLDYHENYKQYLKTKLKLLKMSKAGFVNEEDDSYKLIKKEAESLKFKTYHSRLKFLDKIVGLTKFNRQNYAAAYAVCKSLGIKEEEIWQAMKNFKLPPGRMELVYNGKFKVLIDFAHTPNAFERVLPEVRNKYLKKGGRLIHVFGAAGLRDHRKRPIMGKISSRYAEKIILTEEDYRIEDPKKIADEILAGITNKKSVEIILNREEAIKKAIYDAKEKDVVLLTGKAHEKSLCRGKIEYPWDEFKVVKKYVNLRSGS